MENLPHREAFIQTVTDFEAFAAEKGEVSRKLDKRTRPLMRFMIIGFLIAGLGSWIPPLLVVTIPLAILCFLALFLYLFLHFKVYKNPEMEYDKRYKAEIVPAFIRSLEPEMEFNLDEFEKKRYQMIEHWNYKISHHSSQAVGIGKINDTRVRVSNCTLYENEFKIKKALKNLAEGVFDEIIGSDGESYEDRGRIYFSGLLVQAIFPEKLEQQFVVVPRDLVSTSIFKRNPFKGRREVISHHPIFDEKFALFITEDSSGASQFPEGFFDAMVDFENEVQLPIYASSTSNSLSVAVHWKERLLKPMGAEDFGMQPFDKVYNQWENIRKIVKKWN